MLLIYLSCSFINIKVILSSCILDGYHGSVKAKRNRSHIVKNKSTILLYNKLCELVEALGILLNIQELTDTVILQVRPFESNNPRHFA